MFIAMNRFQVKKGAETAFETVWATRESYLGSMPGFVEFHLLKGPEAEIEAWPSSMGRMGGGELFAAAMQAIAQWGEVTLIVHTDDAIFEFTGSIPAGEIGRGYFNLMQPKGLPGHLRHERCAAVAF